MKAVIKPSQASTWVERASDDFRALFVRWVSCQNELHQTAIAMDVAEESGDAAAISAVEEREDAAFFDADEANAALQSFDPTTVQDAVSCLALWRAYRTQTPQPTGDRNELDVVAMSAIDRLLDWVVNAEVEAERLLRPNAAACACH